MKVSRAVTGPKTSHEGYWTGLKEEIFGPVVTAMPFKAVDDDLIARANDTVYGLAAGIWTKDIGKAHALS